VKSEKSLSIEKAIQRGFFFVNLPVFLIIVSPLFIATIIPESWNLNPIIGLALIPSIIMAWIWWSWALPKWRLWAVKQVDDVELLFDKAIQAQLMWPVGHFFQKTEINSPKQKRELRKVMLEKMDTSDEYVLKIILKMTN